ASKLHSWKVSWVTSPLCPLGCLFPETVFHLFVACPFKWQYWTRVLAFTNLREHFPTALSVWTALLSLKNASNETLPVSTLLVLGTALQALWRYHYRCVFDQELWGQEASFQTFLNSHRFLTD
ncbi:hypothetical protein BD560DRAFT_326855, partial [Blakeslea trispora]